MQLTSRSQPSPSRSLSRALNCEYASALAYVLKGFAHNRYHHLLKTFWTGWRDDQRPDGTIIWTSPTGRTYVTRPGSRLLFPALRLPTRELAAAATQPRARGNVGVMMPKRRRTREQDRAHRIDAERALNADHVAERNEPPPF